jgi:hypothetical protein
MPRRSPDVVYRDEDGHCLAPEFIRGCRAGLAPPNQWLAPRPAWGLPGKAV